MGKGRSGSGGPDRDEVVAFAIVDAIANPISHRKLGPEGEAPADLPQSGQQIPKN